MTPPTVKQFNVNDVGFRFVAVPKAQMTMGISRDEARSIALKTPGVNSALIDSWPEQDANTELFWILDGEITEQQWNAVMNPDRSMETRDTPKTSISFTQANTFMKKLELAARFPTGTFKLPTETQFEVAAQALDLSGMNQPRDTNISCATRVAASAHYASGHHDDAVINLLGGVWEMTESNFEPYKKNSVTESDHGSVVVRGGCTACRPAECLPASRWKLSKNDTDGHPVIGFRPVAVFKE